MVWAQLTSRRSLRDIETSLRAHSDKLYRMGIGTGVSRNNLASTVTGHEERDQTFMEDYTYERGCFYIFDKMYFKTRGLFRVEDSGAYFVTRIKRNAVYRVTESRPVSGTLVLADRTIEFTSRWAKAGYPKPCAKSAFTARRSKGCGSLSPTISSLKPQP